MKALSPRDIYRWDIILEHGDIEAAIEKTVNHWKSKNLSLSPIQNRTLFGKNTFTPASMEDAFEIKLLDRFIRRIYKVRQSDRNRIVKQLKTLLKDSSETHLLRVDIKNCYENIPLEKLISKFSDDFLLTPECINILKNINTDLKNRHNFSGLPRGLSISPTLAELYLERLDREISSHREVIYSARYVDDIIVILPSNKDSEIKNHIKETLEKMGLSINDSPKKQYNGPSKSANFEYLGYAFKVQERKNKPNLVNLEISESKINKIKHRIIKSLLDHKKNNNITLLKRRLEYLSMLKTVKKGKNGDLLAGLAHNYQHVTDDFECLKKVDGFLCAKIQEPRFHLTTQQKGKINKISMYGNTKNRKIGNFSNKQTINIMRAWKNA
nr:antiviral reverse transcriptase Drt3a [Spongiibacter tropicus]